EYQNISCHFRDYQLLIINSNVKRGLVDSAYNQRRMECDEALSIINNHLETPIDNIAQLSFSDFDLIKVHLNDILFKRVRHIITEQDRVLNSVNYLVNKEIKAFAQLLNESHQSLANDYEVSIKEVDFLQKQAIELGAIGSRMIGAGFGGCLIALVAQDQVSSFTKSLITNYEQAFKIEAFIYQAQSSDGVKELINE
ncbi:MAG: galactokinase, partial [Bacilli bacterium]